VTRAVRDAIERMARALGPPVATPRLVRKDGAMVPARHRVFRWRCPVCDHGDWLWKPLVIDTEGRMWCDGGGCSPAAVAREVELRLDMLRTLDRLDAERAA
jgi:hypothetical protein